MLDHGILEGTILDDIIALEDQALDQRLDLVVGPIPLKKKEEKEIITPNTTSLEYQLSIET